MEFFKKFLPPGEGDPKVEAGHLEQEISLIDIPYDFRDKMIGVGAELEVPRRLIRDLRYDRVRQGLPEHYLQTVDFDEPTAKAQKVFEYLGFYMYDPDPDSRLRILPIDNWSINNNPRMARIRQDGKDRIFTVKGPSQKRPPANVKSKEEYEVKLSGYGPTDLKEFLERSGHGVDSIVEKYRTTLNWPKPKFNGRVSGLKVEIDEFSTGFRRAELEGHAQDIEDGLKFLRDNHLFLGKTSNHGQTQLLREQLGLSKKDGPLVLTFKK